MEQVWADMGAGEGAGIAIGAVLVLVLRILLPRDQRRRIVMPLVLLLLHVAAFVGHSFLPDKAPAARPLELVALALLLLSVARSGFLCVVYALLLPRLGRAPPKIFQDIVQAIVFVAVAFVVLRAAGVEPGSLLTTSALLTAVVGLSLQDTLGNMFAGLAILAQRPFDTGDWIQFDEHPEHVGKVVEINWRAVRVLTLEQVDVTVPNSKLADAPIRNYTKPQSHVRRSAFVIAPYHVAPRRVQKLLVDAIGDIPGVLSEPPPSVLTHDFTERGVQYWVRYFIPDFGRREPIAGEVRDRLWYALRREGIPIPPPLRDVSLRQITPESLEHDRRGERAARELGIRAVDFLRALPEETIEQLATSSAERLYAPGEVVVKAGTKGDELFVIERGEVRVVVPGRRGEEVEVAALREGEFFGEMSLMTGEERQATVRAVSECEMLVLGREVLRPVLESSPEMLETISRKLAEREAALDAKRAELRSEAASAQSLDERTSVLLGRIRGFFSL